MKGSVMNYVCACMHVCVQEQREHVSVQLKWFTHIPFMSLCGTMKFKKWCRHTKHWNVLSDLKASIVSKIVILLNEKWNLLFQRKLSKFLLKIYSGTMKSGRLISFSIIICSINPLTSCNTSPLSFWCLFCPGY